MIPLTLDKVAALCGGRLDAGDPGEVVRRVTTDTRELRPGDLFVGLRGDRFDGDSFATAALRDGAVAVVVRQDTAAVLSLRSPRIVVDDGLAALTSLASGVRHLTRAQVVAITGSAGKTSTKDILTALLRPFVNVVTTTGNHNNEVGVPLTILELKPDSQVLVCELAMRGSGQIAHLARIALPDVAVITNVAPAHLELVGSVEEVAAAKAEIFADPPPPATLVVPAGEDLLAPHLRRYSGRLITFGEGGDVTVIEAHRRGFATHALIDAFGRRAAIGFSFCGGHYLHDALAAIGALLALGLSLEDAKVGAMQVVFSELRGELVLLADDGLLLNDSYNANPVATNAAIDHLLSVADGREAVAVLGDMYELGPEAARYHREVGEHAAACKVRLVAVGELARDYLAGVEGEQWYPTVEECVAALAAAVPPGSAALVKGSRAMRLERVAETLVELRGAAGGLPAGAAPPAGSPRESGG